MKDARHLSIAARKTPSQSQTSGRREHAFRPPFCYDRTLHIFYFGDIRRFTAEMPINACMHAVPASLQNNSRPSLHSYSQREFHLPVGHLANKRIKDPAPKDQLFGECHANPSLDNWIDPSRSAACHLSHADAIHHREGPRRRRRRRGRPAVKTNHVILDIKERFTALSHGSVSLAWIPSHIGIGGNEAVDALARAATVSPPVVSRPVNFTDLAESFRRDCFTTSIAKCEADGLHKGKIYFDLFHYHDKRLHGSKHHSLAESLHKKNIIDDPGCACGSEEENLNHVLWNYGSADLFSAQCPLFLCHSLCASASVTRRLQHLNNLTNIEVSDDSWHSNHYSTLYHDIHRKTNIPIVVRRAATSYTSCSPPMLFCAVHWTFKASRLELQNIKVILCDVQNKVPITKDTYDCIWECAAQIIANVLVEGYSNAKLLHLHEWHKSQCHKSELQVTASCPRLEIAPSVRALTKTSPNNFYSESQSDLCYSRGPGREHVAWVLVTLGKSAALLRKVQEVCSAQELTSESPQRPGAPSYIARRGRRATAAAAAVVGSRCLSRGREVAPIPVRPRNGADPQSSALKIGYRKIEPIKSKHHQYLEINAWRSGTRNRFTCPDNQASPKAYTRVQAVRTARTRDIRRYSFTLARVVHQGTRTCDVRRDQLTPDATSRDSGTTSMWSSQRPKTISPRCSHSRGSQERIDHLAEMTARPRFLLRIARVAGASHDQCNTLVTPHAQTSTALCTQTFVSLVVRRILDRQLQRTQQRNRGHSLFTQRNRDCTRLERAGYSSGTHSWLRTSSSPWSIRPFLTVRAAALTHAIRRIERQSVAAYKRATWRSGSRNRFTCPGDQARPKAYTRVQVVHTTRTRDIRRYSFTLVQVVHQGTRTCDIRRDQLTPDATSRDSGTTSMWSSQRPKAISPCCSHSRGSQERIDHTINNSFGFNLTPSCDHFANLSDFSAQDRRRSRHIWWKARPPFEVRRPDRLTGASVRNNTTAGRAPAKAQTLARHKTIAFN
ncbi:unnamed protein product [Trichogramma brassicae]|uniref:RNase H type-1 domain-containing protein n=1 Tax=Trichogramma brassicae TaxID=86971 RepID=A0A6H5IBS5_9HYME|nr:unnamed protein product [Trichogramma brassicae]